eukprot:TRINITY_DN32024_c0_g1_i1.p1 TRINITY_DN32024_c0_g1~~TRINITY_DN32024_c0_g1_i1.p1  ORF type:complete len:115 (+),score=16.17 TRINITY_DN32024_c0_g1_i1:90-434(+)
MRKREQPTSLSAKLSEDEPNTFKIYLPWEPGHDTYVVILFGIAVVFLVLLMVLMYLKMNQLERHLMVAIARESEKSRAYIDAKSQDVAEGDEDSSTKAEHDPGGRRSRPQTNEA